MITSILTVYQLLRTSGSVITETRANSRQVRVPAPPQSYCHILHCSSAKLLSHVNITESSRALTHPPPQSSYAIVLMNMGNSLFLVLIILAVIKAVLQPSKIYDLLVINFLKDCFSPCLLSALNPLIFYWCCKDCQRKVYRRVQRTTIKWTRRATERIEMKELERSVPTSSNPSVICNRLVVSERVCASIYAARCSVVSKELTTTHNRSSLSSSTCSPSSPRKESSVVVMVTVHSDPGTINERTPDPGNPNV